tara:strand:+ start:65 stop:679 length:615 start_codon:yes stop_codon:yes gene_type:complete
MQLIPHEINQNNNFIDAWTIQDESVSDNLIKFFELNYQWQKDGRVGTGEIKKDVKASRDINIGIGNGLEDEAVQNYLNALTQVTEEYKKKYTWSNDAMGHWGITEDFNVQRYLPGEGFFEWHCERGSERSIRRHLTFMTYLNDITDGGETEFYYQKLKIKPKKGLTVIWGTDWTFTHRGLTSPTQTKYIITGWYSFIRPVEIEG